MNDIDTNPNRVNQAPLKTLLPHVQVALVTEMYGGNTGIGAFYASEQNTFVLGGNTLEGGSIGTSSWDNGYTALNNLDIIKKQAVEQSAWTYAGISDVLKAFNLSILTDIFGDIPYEEALSDQFLNPAFDSPESIYAVMHNVLDEAIENLQKDPGPIAPKNDDMFFDGDRELWIKTAYGLKARLYNRLSNVDPEGSATAALDAISRSFENDIESFVFTKFVDTNDNDNPLSGRQIEQPQSAVGNGIFYAMSSFSPTNSVEDDPRANIWFTRVNGQLIAAPNGTADPDFGEPRLDGAKYSKPEIFKWRAAPFPVLSYVELKFIEAESELRLNNRDEANAAYENAVSLALEHASDFRPAVALTGDQRNDYLSLPGVLPGADDLTQEDIIIQKYIYFYQYQSIEAFNDVRRTGFIPVTDPVGRMNRSIYPDSERNRNTSTPLNIDQFTVFEPSTKLFWAK
jgi:hypothetical protein